MTKVAPRQDSEKSEVFAISSSPKQDIAPGILPGRIGTAGESDGLRPHSLQETSYLYEYPVPIPADRATLALMNLLPCPFCSHSRAHLVEVPDQPALTYAIQCGQCGTRGPLQPRQQRAIDKWNERAKTPS